LPVVPDDVEFRQFDRRFDGCDPAVGRAVVALEGIEDGRPGVAAEPFPSPPTAFDGVQVALISAWSASGVSVRSRSAAASLTAWSAIESRRPLYTSRASRVAKSAIPSALRACLSTRVTRLRSTPASTSRRTFPDSMASTAASVPMEDSSVSRVFGPIPQYASRSMFVDRPGGV